MDVAGLNAVEGGAKPLASVDGRSDDHADLVEQSLSEEAAVDVAASHHTDALGPELAVQDGCGTDQVDLLLSGDNIRDAALAQVVQIGTACQLTDNISSAPTAGELPLSKAPSSA